eukprot:snap_masked-scaffold211_size255937-processed-gene-1.13 protein:Tk07169 transcript:snap_masked-scaffold211_size255937-processed-gene-1.13-mRNA-1 annotation:"PREDICTED: uncharacterized protein LOC103506484"
MVPEPAKMLARLAPSRPCRRMLVILFFWTCFCFLIFQLTSREDLVDTSASGMRQSSRELLQKVIETRKPMVGGNETVYLSGGGPTSTTELNFFDMEPAIDRSPKRAEKEVVEELAAQLPNLPLVYLHENKGKNWHYKGNKTCAKFPTLYDLHINNLYWQETETSNGTFYLYGAYLDRRKKNRLGPTIRILGMINRLEPQVKTYCQIWFSGSKEPAIAKILEYKYIWFNKWGNYKNGIFQPYMLACQIPSSHWKEVPVSVSVVENVCDKATNNLRVIYNQLEPGEKKKQFAVCVKGLDFPTDDLSVRLIEWIELLNTLGADKIFLYNLEVHPNVTKVLEHYVKEGKVDLTPISLPGYQPNMQILQHLYLKSKLNNKRQNELIPYNDCLYRNIYRYEYVALLDIDEVILPLKHRDWSGMMEAVQAASLKVKNESRASFNFRNVYFMDEMLNAHRPQGLYKDIPPYLHMMQHVYRSANYTKPGQYVKCFHNTEKVLILHNHFPLGCLGGVCTSYPVSNQVGHLQHYRQDCVKSLKKSCAKEYKNFSVEDTTIWRYKEEVIARTTDALNRLGFFRVPPQPAVE